MSWRFNLQSLVCVLLLIAAPLQAQLGTGTLSGTVFDQSGAVLPGARITVTNTGTGFRRETVSSETGDYRLAGLLPGAYELTVEFGGFSRFVRPSLTLQVDQNARIDVHLQVGSSTENVIVTAQAPLLQSEQSSVGAVVDQRKITDLPLNGRNFVQLATLMPGVNTGDGGAPGGGISIAGARPEQNSFLLDGTINSDQFNNLLNFRPSIDILQEFKIQTSNYSAEFGKGAGGQINLVTKSGTNEFHGTAYEFNRNNAVQARNLFDLNPAFQNQSGKIIAPPFNQNQFGFTAGGPVMLPKYQGKNKTFFFGGYEGFRLRRGNTTLTTVPTAEQRRGDFSRNLTTQQLRTDALGRPILRGTFNDADEFNPRTFPGYGELSFIRNQAFTFSNTHIIGPTTLNEFRFGYLRYAEFTAAENTFAGRDIVKELGVRGFPFASSPGLRGAPQFTISGFAGPGDNEGGRPLRLKNNTFQFIDHFSFNTGRHYLKVGGEIRRIRLDSVRAQTVRGQFSFDSANWTGLSGFTATGQTFGNFLLGLPRQKGRRVGDFAHNLRATEYATFIQDDWKVSPKLTLNMGLRYMLYVPPKDTHDRISTLIYPGGRPGSYSEGATQFLTLQGLQKAPTWGRAGIELPRSIFPVDKKDFGPRFGFAWRAFEKTAVRGGYGIFFDTVQGVITEDVIENIPNVKEDQQTLSIFQDVSVPPAEAFIGYLIENPGPGQFNPGPNDVDPNFRNSYVQNWNFGIQRELGRNFMIEADYVGSKGTRLNRRENTNTAEPNGPDALIQASSVPTQPINPLTGQPFLSDPVANAGLRERFRRLVPVAINLWENNTLYFLDNVFQTTSTAFSNYHSLQLRGEKRVSAGLTFIASWTWSKAMSDATGFSGGGMFDTGNRIQNIFNKRADKGLSSLDHRHRFSYAFVYELPFGANKPFLSGASTALQKFAGGWAVDGIYTFQSGLPMTVKFNGDVFSSGTDNARPDLACNPNLPRGEQTLNRFFKTECFQRQSPIRFGTAGRSTVIGPPINNFDLALMKNTKIGEKVNTQFRTEFFNAFNHPQWNPPNRFIDQASFGVVSSARDARIIQFGLKLIF